MKKFMKKYNKRHTSHAVRNTIIGVVFATVIYAALGYLVDVNIQSKVAFEKTGVILVPTYTLTTK